MKERMSRLFWAGLICAGVGWVDSVYGEATAKNEFVSVSTTNACWLYRIDPTNFLSFCPSGPGYNQQVEFKVTARPDWWLMTPETGFLKLGIPGEGQWIVRPAKTYDEPGGEKSGEIKTCPVSLTLTANPATQTLMEK
jgi:hypothetical protein